MLDRPILLIRKYTVFLCVFIFGLGMVRLSGEILGETLQLGRVSKPAVSEVVNEIITPATVTTKPVVAAEVKSEPAALAKTSYRLRSRDFIRVGVINENDTVIERRINPDGTIDVPFLNQLVPVAGLTITEAQDLLTKRFSRYFKKPQLIIAIVAYAERRVYLSGYVGRAGPVTIPPEENLTLGKALSIAGGIQARGRRSDVAIKRLKPDGETEVILKDMRKIDSGEEPDFILQDEDQVYVEDSRF
ncbi:MAG: polysaccharide biosynthesis/export family protein [Opitutae bacterium]